MKSTIALIIAVALVTLLPTSANATTLTITGGRIVMSQSRDFGSEWRFGGVDFGVHQSEEPGCCGDLSRAFGVAPFVYTDIFVTSPGAQVWDAFVGDQHCGGSINPLVSCGDITLTSPGFAIPPDWPINTLFVATVPFTATGQMLVGGQFDMVGQGFVTGTRCLSAPQAACGGVSESSRLDYSFTVSEPPTLLLTLVSAVAIGIGFVHRPVCERLLAGLAVAWSETRQRQRNTSRIRSSRPA